MILTNDFHIDIDDELRLQYFLGVDAFRIVNNDCLSAIKRYRLISDRVKELEGKGYIVKRVPMGSGGVGQVKELKEEFRYQIGHGVGRYNYARAVIISK